MYRAVVVEDFNTVIAVSAMPCSRASCRVANGALENLLCFVHWLRHIKCITSRENSRL